MILMGAENFSLKQGDCLSVMKSLPDNSVDSVVTDPPYHLTSVSRGSHAASQKPNTPHGRARIGDRGFMGKEWDGGDIAHRIELWEEVLRVLKPGGHLLSFSGSRTYHRMACAIEDAGFEIRDQIMWVYGSGFPKSMDVSKQLDKQAGAERVGTGEMVRGGCRAARGGGELVGSEPIEEMKWKEITEPATDAAKQWDGWGMALKPSHEPIVVARKPLIGTVAENVLRFGTGAINVGGCRVDLNGDYKSKANGRPSQTGLPDNYDPDKANQPDTIGRWPANLIHDGSDEVIAEFPVTASGQPSGVKAGNNNNVFGQFAGGIPVTGFGDSGSAARFFYCAKASRQDRDEGLAGFELKEAGIKNDSGRGFSESDPHRKIMRANNHPTVKPTDLMRYLCRLVTQPGGLVLDPFMGSGSTGKAAILEGFRFVGIDREEEHVEIAEARIAHAVKTFAQENSQQRLFA